MRNLFHCSLDCIDMYNEELSKLIKSVSTPLELQPAELFSAPCLNPKSMFFIEKGRTKHYFFTENGAAKVLFYLGPGWIFGETAYFLSQDTTLYSEAYTPCLLYKFDFDTCVKLLRDSQIFREKLMECLSHKAFFYRTEIENITFNSAKHRLKALICSLAETDAVVDEQWYPLKAACTHAEMGDIIGTTRVTISRLISELSRENFCRTVNHRIQVNAAQYWDMVQKVAPGQ